MFFRKKKKVAIEAPKEVQKIPGFFDNGIDVNMQGKIRNVFKNVFRRNANEFLVDGITQDSAYSAKSVGQYERGTIPDNLLMWYGSQSFIGYQACSMLAQHWLISKACTVPAREAIRKGWEITINDGTKIDEETLNKITTLDKKYKINKNLSEFVKFGRIFGIRVAMFQVLSTDPEYYQKPFNIDGVTKGSYKGISQIDPYWIAPQLDGEAVNNPSSLDFYTPTYWIINGQKVHKSHLVIMINEEVTDILKPTYLYGGVSIPQKIYERVYGAERTINEAPSLAQSKRTNVLKVDMEQVTSDQENFENKLLEWQYYRDNYGVKVIGLEEELQQFDTSLADLDEVIMTQYQLVASAANIPVTKLLGTTPKGFNSTGNYEEASYREELESIQKHDLEPLLDRHYELLIKSEFDKVFDIDISWYPLDSITEQEQSTVNLTKAQTDQLYIDMGALDAEDVNKRIVTDKRSGYNGVEVDEEED